MFPNARLCKAMLDRLTDQAHIIETGNESYRFRRTLEKKDGSKQDFTLPPAPTLRPKRVALRAPQGFAPARGRVMNHHRVGPKEKIKWGQIKLTEASEYYLRKPTREQRNKE